MIRRLGPALLLPQQGRYRICFGIARSSAPQTLPRSRLLNSRKHDPLLLLHWLRDAASYHHVKHSSQPPAPAKESKEVPFEVYRRNPVFLSVFPRKLIPWSKI